MDLCKCVSCYFCLFEISSLKVVFLFHSFPDLIEFEPNIVLGSRERIEMFIKTLGEKVKGMDNLCVLATTHGGFIKDFNLLLVNKYQCSFPCQNGEYGR